MSSGLQGPIVLQRWVGGRASGEHLAHTHCIRAHTRTGGAHTHDTWHLLALPSHTRQPRCLPRAHSACSRTASAKHWGHFARCQLLPTCPQQRSNASDASHRSTPTYHFRAAPPCASTTRSLLVPGNTIASVVSYSALAKEVTVYALSQASVDGTSARRHGT